MNIGARRPSFSCRRRVVRAWRELAVQTSNRHPHNLLNVLGLLVALEPEQAALLDRVCTRPMITAAALRDAGVFASLLHAKANQPSLFGAEPA